jgi:hypothetical protein
VSNLRATLLGLVLALLTVGGIVAALLWAMATVGWR